MQLTNTIHEHSELQQRNGLLCRLPTTPDTITVYIKLPFTCSVTHHLTHIEKKRINHESTLPPGLLLQCRLAHEIQVGADDEGLLLETYTLLVDITWEGILLAYIIQILHSEKLLLSGIPSQFSPYKTTVQLEILGIKPNTELQFNGSNIA